MAARVKELSSEVHRMAHHLHPAKLDQLGLVAAARGFCRELSQKSGLRVKFMVMSDDGSCARALIADGDIINGDLPVENSESQLFQRAREVLI